MEEKEERDGVEEEEEDVELSDLSSHGVNLRLFVGDAVEDEFFFF